MPRVKKTETAVEVPEETEPEIDSVDEEEEQPKTRALPFATLDDADEYLRAVLWGDPGSGKTSSALAATKLGGNVFVLDIERRLKKTALKKRGIDTTRVSVWPSAKDNKPVTYDSVQKVVRWLKKTLKDDPAAVETLVVDSGTELSNLLITLAGDNRVEQKGITDTFEKFEQDFRDNGMAGKMFRRLLRELRDLPCHVIITAHKRRDVDEDTARVTYGPAVSPAIQVDLAGQMDIMLYTRAAEGSRPYRAMVRGSSKYMTKDTFDALPDVLADPSVDRIFEYVFGDLTVETDPVQETLTTDKKKKEED